jgi:hypothetical protein
MKNARLFNRLTVIVLGLTVGAIACELIVFLFPSAPFNPWPPLELLAVVTPAPTALPAPAFPATWTPTPVQTLRAVPTRPTDTPIPTRIRAVSLTPTKNPALPTQSPYKFSPVKPPVLTADKYGAACGNWGGVGGQVLDIDGSPLAGVSIVGWGGPISAQEKKAFVSGSDARINTFYTGDGAYEIYIGAPGDFDFFVVAYDNGRPASPVVKVTMVNDCSRDLALIDFQRNY